MKTIAESMRRTTALAFALVLATTAADAGTLEGMQAYEQGDYATARSEWVTTAAEGDAHAQYNLGVLYAQGQGVEQNYAEASQWYQKAADAGFPQASFNLGNLYRDGLGVEQSQERAVQLYKAAAEAEHPGALNNLGAMHLKGLGVTADPEQAATYFQRAIERGSIRAHTNLGFLYEQGMGVGEDPLEAARLYRKAAAEGDDSATDRLVGLKPRIEAAYPPPASQKELIGEVQTLLTALGYEPGPVDGVMGSKTRNAISSFERSVGSQETGQPSTQLREWLIEALVTVPTA